MKNLQDLEEFEKKFTKYLLWKDVDKDHYFLQCPISEKIKSFILSDRQEVLKMVRRLIIEAVNETNEEHGSGNVYIDMVGETLIEKIENL